MNHSLHHLKALFIPVAAAIVVTACSPPLVKPQGAIVARDELTLIQADPRLANRAPEAIGEAEQAVRVAEQPIDDVAQTQHRVVMAQRKVAIARNQAENRYLEDQRKTLGEQRETARLEARTREADRARNDATWARSDAKSARTDADNARSEAEIARGQADAALIATEAAFMATETARQQADDLKKQLAELNARPTDRGMVVTLGDVLFDTGKSVLKGGDPQHLGKLAAFLKKHPNRSVIIEGHTDNVGSTASNQGLSQRRADAVRGYLIGQGVAPGRLVASGLGEEFPVGVNNSASGRQQNRRVEVIIANVVTASK